MYPQRIATHCKDCKMPNQISNRTKICGECGCNKAMAKDTKCELCRILYFNGLSKITKPSKYTQAVIDIMYKNKIDNYAPFYINIEFDQINHATKQLISLTLERENKLIYIQLIDNVDIDNLEKIEYIPYTGDNELHFIRLNINKYIDIYGKVKNPYLNNRLKAVYYLIDNLTGFNRVNVYNLFFNKD
jgi:hypothetical protein